MIYTNAFVRLQKTPATHLLLFQAFKIISVNLCVTLVVDNPLLKQVRSVKASVVVAFQSSELTPSVLCNVLGQTVLIDQWSYELSVSETRLGECLLDSTTCCLAEIYRRFGGIKCLQH